jgi:hypothetical protein
MFVNDVFLKLCPMRIRNVGKLCTCLSNGVLPLLPSSFSLWVLSHVFFLLFFSYVLFMQVENSLRVQVQVQVF